MAEDIEEWFTRRRASACGDKRRYDSQREALDTAYRIRLETAERLDAYECPFCHAWHLGHPGED